MGRSFIGLLLIFSLFVITWCESETDWENESLYWYWERDNEYINFKTDNTVEFFKWSGSLISKIIDNTGATYEVIENVTPHQMYLRFEENNKMLRVPFWIYKIEDDRLILKAPKEYHKTLGSFDAWVSKYELPTDFIWEMEIWDKVQNVPITKWLYYKWRYYEDQEEFEQIKKIFK